MLRVDARVGFHLSIGHSFIPNRLTIAARSPVHSFCLLAIGQYILVAGAGISKCVFILVPLAIVQAEHIPVTRVPGQLIQFLIPGSSH